MRLLVTALVLAGALTACGQTTSAPSQSAPTATRGYAASGGVVTEEGVVAPADSPAPPPAQPAADGNARGDDQTHQASMPGAATPATFLAYSYQIGLEIPSTCLAGVMDAHIRACQAAGPRLCQLI